MRTHRYLIAALLLAACGSSKSYTAGTQPTSATTTATTTATTVAPSSNTTAASGGGGAYGYPVPPTTTATAGAATLTVINTSLGAAIGDAKGYSLYMYTPDNGTPMCTGTCSDTWKPWATTGAPVAGNGVDGAKVATVQHPSGVTQVTYNGHPLYHYSGDSAPGDTNGQGRNNYWYLVTPAGAKLAG